MRLTRVIVRPWNAGARGRSFGLQMIKFTRLQYLGLE